MKRLSLFLVALFVAAAFANAQGDENSALEFFVVKNDKTKSAVVTSVFNVKMPDGTSLATLNAKVKDKLAESLDLSTIVKAEQAAAWTYTNYTVTEAGEFFSDEKQAGVRLAKVKADLKKKGYNITDYPFQYD